MDEQDWKDIQNAPWRKKVLARLGKPQLLKTKILTEGGPEVKIWLFWCGRCKKLVCNYRHHFNRCLPCPLDNTHPQY